MLRTLPVLEPPAPDRPEVGGPDHPIRKVTLQIARDPTAWDAERAKKVAELFDGLAPEWHTRATADRLTAVADALARGSLMGGGSCLELGSGTGNATRALAAHFERVVAADLSLEMLRRAPADAAPRLRSDASALPFADHSLSAVVLLNMFLFPAEIERVLAPDGQLVFVSSLGDATPIYLAPEEVVDALPGDWSGVTSRAGWGTWTILRRDAAQGER